MGALVSYRLHDSIATITMDDGKVNVLSRAMLNELGAALGRAAADRAVVVLTGREGVFSAGFDLPVLRAGGAEAADLLRAGFDLAARLLAFPTPVLVACPGHAVAMGVFLVLSGDYRIGIRGPYKLTANEVAIGMTMPRGAVEICRQRLTPACFNRAVVLAEVFAPEDAVAAGFLDRWYQPRS
jgi:enoyl-CoA hydratase